MICQRHCTPDAPRRPRKVWAGCIACTSGHGRDATGAHRARRALRASKSWLRDALETDRVSTSASSEAIAGLIGLGPGLTPSGDDFLVGALALLDALAESKAHAALARAIADTPRGLTSPLSDCFLRAAAAGHRGRASPLRRFGGHVGSARQGGRRDPRIGHSSGWDMLAGIATTLQVVAAARGNAFAASLLDNGLIFAGDAHARGRDRSSQCRRHAGARRLLRRARAPARLRAVDGGQFDRALAAAARHRCRRSGAMRRCARWCCRRSTWSAPRRPAGG